MNIRNLMEMLLGTCASQSLANLKQWLDNVVISICPDSIAVGARGQRLDGIYHQMREDEADEFLSMLTTKLLDWGVNCHVRGISCGILIKSTTGSERGLKVFQMIVGPFLG